MTVARATQVVTEVLASYTPEARATQVVIEVLYSGAPVSVWNASENNVWSVGPWVNGVPEAADPVLFNGTSNVDATLDENTADLATLTIEAGYTGTLDADTFDVTVSGDLISDGTAIDMGSGTWTVNGNLDLADTTITKGSATVTTTGSGAVNWDIGDQAIGDVVMAHSGTVTLASGFTADTYVQTSGTVDVSAETLVTVGNMSVTGGALTDLVGADITVGGDFTATVDLIGSGSWDIDVTGTATVTGVTVTNLQSVNPIVVIDGVDGGGNGANITFEASSLAGPTQLTMRSSFQSARPMDPYT